MKRLALIGWTLGIVAVAFCAGRAAKPALKFPYAGVRFNEPASVTLLEELCLRWKIDPRPFKLTEEWELTTLLAEPKPKGVLFKADIDLREGVKPRPRDPQFAKELALAEKRAMDHISRRILTAPRRPAPPGGLFAKGKDPLYPFKDFRHCRIELYRRGRFVRAVGLSRTALGR